MGERARNIAVSIRDKWLAISRKMKIITVTLAVVIIAGAALLVNILNKTEYATLFKGVEATEAAEIVQIIQNQGVEVRMSGGTIYVQKEEVDRLNMELSMLGYPKSGLNYDIWDNVDMFSTDFEKRETKRQQSEARITAALQSLEFVNKAVVILDVPENKDYVINADETQSSISVVLHIKNNESLSAKEIAGVYNLISTTISNLAADKISVTDSLGTPLYLNEYSSEDEMALYYTRLQFQQKIESTLRAQLDDMYTKLYGPDGYAITVWATLNYNKEVTESTTFTPSVGDNGMVSEQTEQINSGGTPVEGGEITVDPNADLSPDYPTYIADGDAEYYYDWMRNTQYKVNEEKKQIQKDGYVVENMNVTLTVNANTITEAVREQLASQLATAAGTNIENVSVFNQQFYREITQPLPEPEEVLDYRDYLLYAVIALGAILIILLVLMLLGKRSRKKKRAKRKAEEAAAAEKLAAQGAGDFFNIPESIDFSIPSLTEAASHDSKETALKREISDFSKQSPEIVAQIIRSMLKDELD